MNGYGFPDEVSIPASQAVASSGRAAGQLCPQIQLLRSPPSRELRFTNNLNSSRDGVIKLVVQRRLLS